LPPAIKFIPGKNYILSNNDTFVTCTAGIWNCNVTTNVKVSSGTHAWTVKLSTGYKNGMMIGMTPFDTDMTTTNIYDKYGFYFWSDQSSLYSGPFNYMNKVYASTQKLVKGSTITIKVDFNNTTISFVINGTDCGIAYKSFPIDKPLSLCILLCYANESVELM